MRLDIQGIYHHREPKKATHNINGSMIDVRPHEFIRIVLVFTVTLCRSGIGASIGFAEITENGLYEAHVKPATQSSVFVQSFHERLL